MSDDAHLVERRIASTTLLRGSFIDVRRDTVALPDGAQATREYVVHPGAVVVVPLLDDGRLLLERQYRHPVERVMLEFPAGKIDPGEAPADCALRELREETGYTAGEWAYAGSLHNAVGYSTECIEIWFARRLTAGVQELDAGEFVELVTMHESELDALAARGDLTDAKTLIALLWLQRWRAGAWPLVFRDVAGIAS